MSLTRDVFLVFDVGMNQLHPQIIVRLTPHVLPIVRHYVPWFGIALIFLLLIPLDQVRAAWGASYHGQVVDAETNKPIEGAVVMVEWHKKPKVAIGGIAYFHNAREQLTDPEGRFSLDSSPGVDWNPFTYIQEPWIIVFYPGYRPFTAAHPQDIGIKADGDVNKISEAFERGVVVKLSKAISGEELRRFTDLSGFGLIFATYEMIPNFYRLINVQRKLVGMKERQYP